MAHPQTKLGRSDRKIELFSGTYFGACALGGILGEYF